MIRKLRTQRDNQQWILDLAMNMRAGPKRHQFDRFALDSLGRLN